MNPFVFTGWGCQVDLLDDGGKGNGIRSSYLRDFADEEWSFVAPRLALSREDVPQRPCPLCGMYFNELRYVTKPVSVVVCCPTICSIWTVVHKLMRRWMAARCFEIMVGDLRILLRDSIRRQGKPTAMTLGYQDAESTLKSGSRGGYDGVKRRHGSKVHAAIDTQVLDL